MAQYPIKMLKDENGTPFVPLVSTEALRTPEGETIEEKLEKKLEPSNIIAGTDITLSVDGNNITINNASKGVLIDNLTTEQSGVGSLDAHQGKVLKDMIPDLGDTGWLYTSDTQTGDLGIWCNNGIIGTVFGRKIGNIVELNFEMRVNGNSEGAIFLLNEAFRPREMGRNMYAILRIANVEGSGHSCNIRIGPEFDGHIYIEDQAALTEMSSSTEALYLRGNVIYFT